MSIVLHFDNESCRPQSISLYNGATVLSSAASHAEIKVHYRLDVTKKRVDELFSQVACQIFRKQNLPKIPETKF